MVRDRIYSERGSGPEKEGCLGPLSKTSQKTGGSLVGCIHRRFSEVIAQRFSVFDFDSRLELKFCNFFAKKNGLDPLSVGRIVLET